MYLNKSFGLLLQAPLVKVGQTGLSTQHGQQFYDVIIVGGGMVGSALACALGSDTVLQDRRVLVLEAGKRVKLEELPPTYSNRVSTISSGSQRLLEKIGAWKHLENMRAKPFLRMQVWDACGDGYVTFAGSDDLEDEVKMGHIVENNVLITALEMQLENLRSNVDILYETKLKKFRIPPLDSDDSRWVEVVLENGQTFATRLLVGADGHNSHVRQHADIDSVSYNYKQSGVVATLSLSEPTENTVAWQRFLPTGPIALLPLTDNKSSLVWSTTSTHAKDLVNLSDDQFVKAVNEALTQDIVRNPLSEMASRFMHNTISMITPDYLGLQIPPTITKVDEKSRAWFPLGLSHASYYVKHRLALIGDAAHRIHPLAGQGVNLGFGDVECLRKVLREATIEGQDLGSMEHLLKYETARQKQVTIMMGATHGLNTLFSTTFLPFVVLRNLGFQMTNAINPIKKQIVQYAMK